MGEEDEHGADEQFKSTAANTNENQNPQESQAAHESEQTAATSKVNSQEQSSDEFIGGQRACEVERIVARRMYQGKVQYQVRWKGYNEEHDLWKYHEDLKITSNAAVLEFRRAQKSAAKASKGDADKYM